MSNKSIEYLRKAYKGSISKEIFDKLEFLYKLIVSPPKRRSVSHTCSLPAIQINNDLAGLSEAHRVNFEKIFPQEIAVLYKTVPDISLKFVSTLILELLKPKFLNRFKENSSNSNSSQSLFGTWEHLLRIFVNSLEVFSCFFIRVACYIDTLQRHTQSRVQKVRSCIMVDRLNSFCALGRTCTTWKNVL